MHFRFLLSCCSPRSRTLARLGRSDGSITSPRPAVAAAVANISVRTGTGAVLMRAPRLGRLTATRRTCQCCSTRTPTSSARFQPGRAHACRKASLGPTTRCRRARPLDSHAAVSSSRIWVGVCDVMWCTQAHTHVYFCRLRAQHVESAGDVRYIYTKIQHMKCTPRPHAHILTQDNNNTRQPQRKNLPDNSECIHPLGWGRARAPTTQPSRGRTQLSESAPSLDRPSRHLLACSPRRPRRALALVRNRRAPLSHSP